MLNKCGWQIGLLDFHDTTRKRKLFQALRDEEPVAFGLLRRPQFLGPDFFFCARFGLLDFMLPPEVGNDLGWFQ